MRRTRIAWPRAGRRLGAPKLQQARLPVDRLDVTVLFDPDRAAWDLTIGDGRAGPAGRARAELLPDVTAVVDVADPARLLGVTVDLPDVDPEGSPTREALTFVARLFGTEVARLLVRRPAQAQTFTAFAIGSVLANQWRAARLGFLISSLRPIEPTPWRSLEGALLAASVGLPDRTEQLRSMAMSSVCEVGERVLVDAVPPDGRRRAVRRLAQLAELSGSPVARTPLAVLRRDRRSRVTEPVERYLVELDGALVDPDVVQWRTGAKVAWRRQRGLLEVRVRLVIGTTGDVSTHWARLHELVPGELPVVYHVAGMAAVDGDATATMPVESHAQAARLRIDVTLRPRESAWSPEMEQRLVLRAEAEETGALAGDLLRRGSWAGAAEAWLRCAALWREAKAFDRAVMAQGYAVSCLQRAGDHVAAARVARETYEAADLVDDEGVYEHLGRLRPEPVPFDVDLLDLPGDSDPGPSEG